MAVKSYFEREKIRTLFGRFCQIFSLTETCLRFSFPIHFHVSKMKRPKSLFPTVKCTSLQYSTYFKVLKQCVRPGFAAIQFQIQILNFESGSHHILFYQEAIGKSRENGVKVAQFSLKDPDPDVGDEICVRGKHKLKNESNTRTKTLKLTSFTVREGPYFFVFLCFNFH